MTISLILFEAQPLTAVSLGLHEYDGRLPDFSAATLDGRLRSARGFRARLESIEEFEVGTTAWLDRKLLERACNSVELGIEKVRFWQRDPRYYSRACDASIYVKRDYAALDERVAAVIAHLQGIPRVLDQARANLDDHLPRVHVTTAIDIYSGLLEFSQNGLQEAVTDASSALKTKLSREVDVAADALASFVQHLREERLPAAHDNYAIGESAFRDLLSVGEAVDVDLATLLSRGEEDLERNRERFERAARQIDPSVAPVETLRAVSRDHPPASELIPLAHDLLGDLERFVRERDLVSIPAEHPCHIRPTPPFLRWAFAMLDAPGALETAKEAFYYVTLPEESWSEQQTEEWLGQFAPPILTLVSIHEAWPGHFLHWLHYINAPTRVTKTFDAYSFLEAWAHYVEEMMLDEGFGDDDPNLLLAQSTEALIRNVRLIVAIRMHAGDLTVENAQKLFEKRAYLAPHPARKEAERGTFDPGYLNYTLGKLMLKKLRADCQKAEGTAFDLKRFHDRFLSFGAPPVPFVRQMMLAGGEDGELF